MAERTGLEPATPCVTGRYSNQLNYRSALCSPSGTRRILITTRVRVNAFPRATFCLLLFSPQC
ncbi:hypothetical protein BN1184_AI_00100 [Pantoea ananatis]|nr:hypothetical protein BN1182_AM_00790 [Pantoea ananatis]CRH32702.1 hypothetical protein BN1183_AI_00790 [Pantoea ananatis]CRH36810.1 hypothetical protein BN1184_AI_00100 [Pantoea ananatis]